MQEEPEDPQLAESFTLGEWKSIKRLDDAVKSIRRRSSERTDTLDEELETNNAFNLICSEVQNKQIRLQIYKRQIEEAKQRLQNANNRQVLMEEVIENKKKAEIELEKDVRQRCIDESITNESFESLKLTGTKLRNELIFRRRFMLFELYSIYFTDRFSSRRKEKNCNCSKFDVIRGLHLPACSDRYGHNEIEMTAALGHLSNLLTIIGRILNYNYLSPLFFKSSKSFILERNTHQIFHLFDITTRSHRDRFVHAYLLLNRNIVQLRYDLGLDTKEGERPIQNLQDAMLCAIGKSVLPCSQIMRCLSIHSPSLVVPDTQSNNSPNENNDDIRLRNSVKIRNHDENILDVVSAKNETFDVTKLCSRSIT